MSGSFFIIHGGPGVAKSHTWARVGVFGVLPRVDEASKPEWQRRRDRSAEAKARLIARMRGR